MRRRSLLREFAAAVKPKPPPKGVVGQDGPSWYSDLFPGGEDPNDLLRGRLKFPIYEEMRKSDAAVRSNLAMYKLPLIRAEWSFDPHDDSPEAQLVADACSWQFGLGDHGDLSPMDMGWSESLRLSLTCLDFGAHFEEYVWSDELVEWVGGDGQERPMRPLIRLAPRFASSIREIETDDKLGTIKTIVQDLPDAKPIPGSKIQAYVVAREGNDWWGTALIRPMYGPWKLKKALMVAAAIGWDRWASGVPVVRYPYGSGDEGRRTAEEIGRNVRQHERGYVALEGPEPEKGGQWGLDLMTGSGSLADPIPLLRHYDQQISYAALTMFSSLGVTETGSRAVGEVLEDPYLLALEATADTLKEVRSRGAVRQFVTHNFGPDTPTPKLLCKNIGKVDVAKIVQAIAALSGAGFNFTDTDTQNDLRGMLDLRELSTDDVEAIEAAREAGFQIEETPAEGEAPPVEGEQPGAEGSSAGL